MFLRQVKNVIFGEGSAAARTHITTVSRLLFSRNASGSINLLEKWKTKFQEENVPEVESSIKNILAHVLKIKKVIFGTI